MFQNLDMFKTAMSMARHAGAKQALTSQNIANSDTPGYSAQTVTPFEDWLPRSHGGFEARRTRDGHLEPVAIMNPRSFALATSSDPNGNSVNLETEILTSVEAKRQHDRALAIYRASLGILRSTLSKQ